VAFRAGPREGYVIVHNPRYMKRAGDYVLQLSPQEIKGLMRSLIDHQKILEFDETVAHRRKRDATWSDPRWARGRGIGAGSSVSGIRVGRIIQIPGLC
jgi:hypothetical protein